MKRSCQSEPNLNLGGRLKRRTSSVFSISTTVDECDVVDSLKEEGGGNDQAAHEQTLLKQPASSSLLSKSQSALVISPDATPLLPTISLLGPQNDESLSSEDDEGFFIDEEPTTTSASTMDIAGDKNTQVNLPTDLRTGIIFEGGELHFDSKNRFHKERPARIQAIRQVLMERSSSKDKNNQQPTLLSRCHELCFSNDTVGQDKQSTAMDFLNDEDYLRVHLPGYLQRLDRISSCTCCETLEREASQFKSIYFTSDSYNQAKQAAASLCQLMEEVVQGRLDNGFGIIRPPGHHAEPGMAGGYCILNNVAIAAAYARDRLGLERILIVDWDIHHGNGTQQIFLDDPHVLYFSVHRWQGGNFFPFLPASGPTTVGVGKGVGKTVNVGWSQKGMGDNEYYAVWDHVLLPLANEFQPELVLVSAGFDGAEGDMGECYVTPECFGNLMRSLKGLADGKIVAALEGGYVRSVLGNCVASVITAMLESTTQSRSHQGQEAYKKAPIPLENIDRFAAKNIQTTMDIHKKYWSCFQ